MKREIKFRAWNEEHNEMIEPLNPVWFEENNWSHDDYQKCANEEGYVLMQYTGLTDKNGVEIYEGDVVKRIGDAYTSEFCAPVKWDDDIAGFTAFKENCVDENGQFEHKDVFDYKPIVIEVIGNIYQNPELL